MKQEAEEEKRWMADVEAGGGREGGEETDTHAQVKAESEADAVAGGGGGGKG